MTTTAQEKRELEAFNRMLVDARVLEAIGRSLCGLTSQQRSEVTSLALESAWNNRETFEPGEETVWQWIEGWFDTSRLGLRAVRREVKPSYGRCTCYGEGPCAYRHSERTADHAPEYDFAELDETLSEEWE